MTTDKRSPRQIMEDTRTEQRRIITASMIFTSRAPFDTNDAARVLKVDRSVAANVVDCMADDGILTKHTAQNKKITYSAKGVKWLRQPWRARSNADIGVVVTRFGCL